MFGSLSLHRQRYLDLISGPLPRDSKTASPQFLAPEWKEIHLENLKGTKEAEVQAYFIGALGETM